MFHVLKVNTLYLALHLLILNSQPCVQAAQEVCICQIKSASIAVLVHGQLLALHPVQLVLLVTTALARMINVQVRVQPELMAQAMMLNALANAPLESFPQPLVPQLAQIVS